MSLRPLLLLFLVGCSDYQINHKSENGGGGDPDITVDPLSVSLDGVCDSQQVQVTITNEGGSILTVSSVEVDGEGWGREAMVLPISLDPGESTVVLLDTSGGKGTLTIGSDDPDESVVEVDLDSAINQAPVVSIGWPADGDVIAEGQDLAVAGTVSDDLDAAEDLLIEWSSDTMGVLWTDPAAADGSTGFDWPAADRPTGTQTLTLKATDQCGVSSSATARICQDGAYSYDALSLASWHYEGSAAWDAGNSYLVLTEALPNQVGTAFETSHPVDGSLVDISFQFYIGDGNGADGISLTALDTNRMTTFLGGTGCGIGFGGDAPCTAGPALPGWSIEVDTYYNGDADPTTADHVAFMFDGDVDNPQVWAELPEMEDTGWHLMEVSVSSPHVTVKIDGVTYIDNDLSGNFSFPAYVGFTAGTGGETNRHLIDELQVTDYYCQ